MRSVSVDERDSTWERHDPRFRVYVFEGADNTVTTVDILDATVDEALEAAHGLSENENFLWALALVDDDSRGLRGLVWLSGMDYNDTPETARQWQLRRQMQNRYLSARSRRGLPPVLPNGLRLVRLFPEWASGWPLWEDFTDHRRLTGNDLGLSQPLSDALYAWNQSWLARPVEGPVLQEWVERGFQLLHDLRSELDGIAEVRPDFLM